MPKIRFFFGLLEVGLKVLKFSLSRRYVEQKPLTKLLFGMQQRQIVALEHTFKIGDQAKALKESRRSLRRAVGVYPDCSNNALDDVAERLRRFKPGK